MDAKQRKLDGRVRASKLAGTGKYPDSLSIEHAVGHPYREDARAWPEWFRQELDQLCRIARNKVDTNA
jgi:hypothetical protein